MAKKTHLVALRLSEKTYEKLRMKGPSVSKTIRRAIKLYLSNGKKKKKKRKAGEGLSIADVTRDVKAGKIGRPSRPALSPEEIHDLRINQQCPRCKSTVDESGYCSTCDESVWELKYGVMVPK